jgi:glyoxylase-like metal-dependent hydrolase (beta-lactamase superfamily II)
MLRPGIEGDDDTFRADRRLADGDVVEGADHRLEALHTPGHASNHLCFLLEAGGDRVLFTGDHVMEGSTVVIAPLDGDMAEYLAQLRRVKALTVDLLLPGHGEPIADPDDYLQGYLDHRAARTAKVLAALAASGPDGATCAELVERAYTDVSPDLHPIAVHSVWATLRAVPEARSEDPDTLEARWVHRPPPPAQEGGEPACWSDKVCEACGAVIGDGPHRECAE